MKEELNLMIEMLSDTIGTRAVDATESAGFRR